MSFEVTIKSPGKLEPFKVEITAENTVEELLDKCKEHLTDLNDKESIFIILKGKMLNTDQKVGDLGVDSSSVFHIIKKPKVQQDEENVVIQEETKRNLNANEDIIAKKSNFSLLNLIDVKSSLRYWM